MKTITREVYVTNDDTEFTDQSEALAYQAQLENEILIDDFLTSLVDKTEQAKSRMRNDIVKFLGFQATYNINPPTENEAPTAEKKEV